MVFKPWNPPRGRAADRAGIPCTCACPCRPVSCAGVGEEEWSLVGDGLCRADDGEYAKRNGVSPYLAALHGVVENTGQDGLAECKAACRKRVPQCVAINYDEKIGDCDLVGTKLGTTQFGGSFGAFVGGSPASEFGSVDRDIVTYSSAHDKREGGHVCLVYRPGQLPPPPH